MTRFGLAIAAIAIGAVLISAGIRNRAVGYAAALLQRLLTPRGVIAAAATGAIVLAIVTGVALMQGRRAAAAEGRVQQLQTERLIVGAQAAGWEVATGVERQKVGELLERIRDLSADSGALARELETAQAQPIARTELDVVATGSAAAPAVQYPDSTGTVTDSATAEIYDGPLTAKVAYFPAAEVFRLDWRLKLEAELVHAIAPDGRLVVFARSPDPRVDLAARLEYQLPKPARGPSRIRWLAGGALLGAIGWEFVR